ncbi:SAM-dependent methyltransferase [Embleya sp. NPDC008237]|uniref:SAM-dependent methyltransferase n=1 Tax=Embleya sp. NPDC008237 TaxID=3363978 RepID=UPI0036E2BFFA
MHEDTDFDPPPIDTETPSVARMYDYLLGGTDNYVADRVACEQLLRIVPDTRALALNNRAFLRRVVRVLADRYGIRQFVDHGSGLPTRDNVHQVAQAVDPSCRVVYVDNDPTVLAHGRTLLDEDDESTLFLQADMRRTDDILDRPLVREMIDFDRPVAALFVSVLHCIPEQDDPKALVRRVAAKLCPGSFLVVCQLVSDDPSVREGVTRFMAEATDGNWGEVRPREAVHDFLEGLEIMPPGLMEVTDWHPDTEPRVLQSDDFIEYGGLARVR